MHEKVRSHSALLGACDILLPSMFVLRHGSRFHATVVAGLKGILDVKSRPQGIHCSVGAAKARVLALGDFSDDLK